MTSNTQLEPKQPLAIAEERIILHNISWETFERLLIEAGDNRNTRFHYLDGMLEIMSPLSRHEGSNRFIESLISAIADELDLNLRKLGSLTLKRRDRHLIYHDHIRLIARRAIHRAHNTFPRDKIGQTRLSNRWPQLKREIARDS